jgi:hypothetical protein
VADLRCYPDAMKFSSNDYFFFFLATFFAFFAFFAFLAMLPSVIPKVDSNASRVSTCTNSEYTTIAKLILRVSKRVNDRHTVATCDRTSPCVMRGWEEVFMSSKDETDDSNTEPSLGSFDRMVDQSI